MMFGVQKYLVYADQAYGIKEVPLCPYPGQVLTNAQFNAQSFNRSTSLVKQAVEWALHKIIFLFAFSDLKKYQKLLIEDVETLFKTSVMLSCHTYLYGSETAQYFNVAPPTMEDYIGVVHIQEILCSI